MFIDNICMGPISFACVQASIYKTRNDDDRHTCAYLFIVVVHQLKRFLLTLSLLLCFGVIYDIFFQGLKKLLWILIRKCLYNRYVNLTPLETNICRISDVKEKIG
jgi:hypothetical protein